MTITVVCDNNPYKEGLESAWGFSAIIDGAEKPILFDTGSSGSILLGNMGKLAIDPHSVDLVVLSHIHGDHTGGLADFLEENPGVTVYIPKSFPKRFKDNLRRYCAGVVEVEKPIEICEGVYSTSQVGGLIPVAELKEQSLIIQTEKGLIVIAGCAHPGILKIVNMAKGFLKEDIFLVIGGFHLEWTTRGKIKRIISAFKEAGVRYVGPCHCSGHKAGSLFKEHFGENYINVGTGKIVTLADLE